MFSPDRDEYVTFILDNLNKPENYSKNFDKVSNTIIQ